ncbi:hypothetical protein D2E25_0281 [Bifidobacterium goeldii]|uniref:Uncharacterized protein n=1 Tax=Bifidobacterium goeldii TaxID=2306975 RepID=A0A430FM30_9BIFI|nr:hypothetical protein [Bifidobacterium goeldii]RSX53975.1 hypothetical protein D2E25_0281 [Bifidobacterium goeldii]
MQIALAKQQASSAVKSLRDKSLLDEVPKKLIAQKTGVDRNTVTHRLRSSDMLLSAFLGTARAIGADPVKVLDSAIKSTQEQEMETSA